LGDAIAQTGKGQFMPKTKPDHYIPTAKRELVAHLIARAAPMYGAGQPECFVAIVTALIHFNYHAILEQLRESYGPFNPETTVAPAGSAALKSQREWFNTLLSFILEKCNFKEVSRNDIQAAHDKRHWLKARLHPETKQFAVPKVYIRGATTSVSVRRKWLVRKVRVETEFKSHIVMVAPARGTADPIDIGYDNIDVRPGSIIVKYFRNIPFDDIQMLYPKVRALMSPLDKVLMWVPAVVGTALVLAHALPGIATLALVGGYYLGFYPSVSSETLASTFAATTAVLAIGGLLIRQRLRFQARALKYQKDITDKCYFRNISNNSGIFDHLVAQAEEQETKEVLLAYFWLLEHPQGMTSDQLDRVVEGDLRASFGLTADFEVEDGLAKLADMGLCQHHGDRFFAIPLAHALVHLDKKWDAIFSFPPVLPLAAPASINNWNTNP
jgi:Protein of unknown function (DUF3754)